MQYLEALVWMEMFVPIHEHGYLHDETKFKKIEYCQKHVMLCIFFIHDIHCTRIHTCLF